VNDLLIDINDEIDKQIVFAAIGDYDKPTKVQGVWYFPDEEQLRLYRLKNKNVIWLQELADPKCKKCYGKGSTGVKVVPVKQTIEELAQLIEQYIDDEPVKLRDELIKLLSLPPHFKNSLDTLISIIQSEISNTNIKVISWKYAKIIKNDFSQKQIQWCRCYLKKYNEEVNRVRRQIKFGIN
jgi:hypothetical protein